MSSTTRKRKSKGGDSDEEAILVDVDSPKEVIKKAKSPKSPKSPSKKSGKKAESEAEADADTRQPQRLFDEWGREVDKDGWLVDPIERLKQGRIGEMYVFIAHF